MAGKASDGFKASTIELLQQLFPQLARVYRNTHYGSSFYSSWRRAGRVCSPEVYAKYFLLAVPKGEVSEAELRAFLASLDDLEAAKRTLEAAVKLGKARNLLERLEDFTSDIAQDRARTLLALLFDEGDNLRFESRGFLDIAADWQVPRLIFQSLSRFGGEAERHAILLPLVQAGTSLFTVVQEISLLCPKEDSEGERLLTDVTLWEELRDAALVRIREAEASEHLWGLKRLVYVLYRWREWAAEGEVAGAAERYTGDDSNMLRFVSAFVSESRSHGEGDKVSRVHRRLSKKELGDFVPLDKLAERLCGVVSSGSGVNADTARALLEALEAKPGFWE